MNTLHKFLGRLILVCCAVIISVSDVGAQSTGYPEVFNPFEVLDINLTMTEADWATVQGDMTYDIELPAMMYSGNEPSLFVSVRRKSGDPIGGKISLKVDVNEYVVGQEWHGLKKLSLENGDDADVVSEGFAWFIHQQAAKVVDGYLPGHASWVNVNVNGVSQGIYVNVEQVDKQFLRNRDMYTAGSTWLYKQGELGPPEIKVGDFDSPTSLELDFSPFNPEADLSTMPDEATLAQQLPQLIDMQTLLAVSAVDAFVTNPDELMNKGKNFYYADFIDAKRMYIPWDQDSVIRRPDLSVYVTGEPTAYQQAILNNPAFRRQYNEMFLKLLAGPLAPEHLTAYLDQLEPVLTPSLDADPNSKVGGEVAEHFDSLRDWSETRHANVLQQVLADMGIGANCLQQSKSGDLDCDGQVGLLDLVILGENYGKTGLHSDVSFYFGDVDGDGDVGLLDVVTLGEHYGQILPAPEPTSISLVAFSGLLLLRFRRAR